jgi:UPF0755 protein
MTARFREAWQQLQTSADVHRTVTLASLVEKEGKLPEERPQIAAVFLRRLEVGMKLDCDPTTIYAALLEGRWRGTIHRSDLDSGNPYNTYRHAGLPPGPIGNPGRVALEAVLKPAPCDYLYFVALGDGRHAFSRNYGEHLVARQTLDSLRAILEEEELAAGALPDSAPPGAAAPPIQPAAAKP